MKKNIKYYARRATMLVGQVKFFAQVVTTRVVDLDELVRLIEERGSTLTRTDIKAVLELLARVIAGQMRMGNKVVTPFGVFALKIKGGLDGPDDVYRSGRNSIEGKVALGAELKKELQKPVTFEKIDNPKVLPEPQRFTDAKSGLDNRVISSGMPARIKGKRLKFDIADEKQGVFFVSGEQAIRAEVYLEAGDRRLVFNTPLLEKGKSYELQVRVANAAGKIMKGEMETNLVADELPVVSEPIADTGEVTDEESLE